MESLAKFMDILPTLHGRKNSTLALIFGLIIGGLLLEIYFRSVVDFVIPIGLAIVSIVILGGDVGIMGGAIIAGLWGFLRVINSNERLERETRVS